MNHLVHWLMQLCTVHIFIIELHYNLLLYTQIVYNLMVFQDFDLRSFRQVHGHWK